MAAGIRIVNDSGTIQIDETYRNVFLIEKRALWVSHNFEVDYATVSVVGSRVLVMMESANYSPFLSNTNFDGTTWSYTFGFNYMGGPVGDTVYAYIFNWLDTPPSDTVGFKVWDAAGAMVFSSAAKPLKIVSIQDNTTGFTGTSGRKYVPLVIHGAFYAIGLIGYTYGLRSSGNVITPNDFAVASGQPFTPLTAGLYAAVDVTHY